VSDLDVVLPRIGASITEHGLAVVNQFDMMGVPLVNHSQPIARSRDKLRSLQLLSRAGLDIPKTVMASDPSQIHRALEIVGGPPCVPAQLGVATCPCRGHVDEDEYRVLTDLVRTALTSEPGILLRPLESRMHRLAREERYEEAAATRDRLSALARALQRQRTVAMLHAAERIELDGPIGTVELRRGRVVLPGDEPEVEIAPDTTDELFTVARWLRQTAGQLRLVRVDGCFASRLPAVVDPCA
jgi:hypothetical protein